MGVVVEGLVEEQPSQAQVHYYMEHFSWAAAVLAEEMAVGRRVVMVLEVAHESGTG